MIIKPYNQIQKGDNSDTIAAEFPACKLFIPFDDGAGDTPREVVSGGTLDMTGPPNSIDWASAENAATLVTFSLSNIALPSSIIVGAKRALFVAIGSGATISSINLVNSSNSTRLGLDLVGSTNRVQTDEGSSTPTIAAPSGVMAHAIQFIPGTTNEGNAYQSSEAAVTTPVSENGTADLTTMEDIEKLATTIVVGDTVLYSLQLWVFSATAPPTDAEIGTMLAWSLNAHIAGNKYLYPGWLGKT